MSSIYSGEMVWFIGAVEDRDDPKELGRVKVRCFGIHNEDKSVLRTEDLPWATIMVPANSAGTGSVGQSATGIVQGAWVVGFFTDGQSMQQPLIMGTLPSTPYEPKSGIKENTGFVDPEAVNPISGEFDNDQPISATSNFDTHPSHWLRNDVRQLDVETAIPSKISTVAADAQDSYYERPTWSTPETHNGYVPKYPYNKVLASESGHTIEVDDTPDNPRLAQFHRSGTNYEIHNDGSKVETIVGDNYTIVLSGNNMYVKGNMNITVDQDLRMLVKGNYHLEVEGEVTENFKSSRQTKIKNSEFKETGNDFVSNVTDDYTQRIGGMENRIVDSDIRTTIGGKEERLVTDDFDTIVLGNKTTTVKKDENHAVVGTLDIKSKGDLTMETESNMVTDVDLNKTVSVGTSGSGNLTETVKGNVSETYTGNQTTAVTGNIDIDGARIDLN